MKGSQKYIKSYGIIVFSIPKIIKQSKSKIKNWRTIRNKQIINQPKSFISTIEENDIQFLLICRKHTMGFVEIIRGKYDFSNPGYIQTLINLLTVAEKYRLLTLSFHVLWKQLWNQNQYFTNRKQSKQNKLLFNQSQKKFTQLISGFYVQNQLHNLHKFITNSPTRWTTPEWGFPKGRKNRDEYCKDCALREFYEETNYTNNDIQLLNTTKPFYETFCGHNKKMYKNIYFLGRKNTPTTCILNFKNKFQKFEVSDIRWVSSSEALQLIRPDNKEKKQLIKKICKYIMYKKPYKK